MPAGLAAAHSATVVALSLSPLSLLPLSCGNSACLPACLPVRPFGYLRIHHAASPLSPFSLPVQLGPAPPCRPSGRQPASPIAHLAATPRPAHSRFTHAGRRCARDAGRPWQGTGMSAAPRRRTPRPARRNRTAPARDAPRPSQRRGSRPPRGFRMPRGAGA